MNKIEIPLSEKELKVPKEILDAFDSNPSNSEVKESKNESLVNFEISQQSVIDAKNEENNDEDNQESSMFFTGSKEDMPKDSKDFDLTDSDKENENEAEGDTVANVENKDIHVDDI